MATAGHICERESSPNSETSLMATWTMSGPFPIFGEDKLP